MSASKLREFLESVAGEQELEFIIPHPLLPPRYHRLSEQRNMVVFLGLDFTIHIRWEGARRNEWHSITPKAFARLMREVMKRMTQYRRDLGVFARFVEAVGEHPDSDPRLDSPFYWRKIPQAQLAGKAEDHAVLLMAEINRAAETQEAQETQTKGEE